MNKDTIITVMITTNTTHEIRMAGMYNDDMRNRLRDAVEQGQDITDVIQLLEDEEMRVLSYDKVGKPLDCTATWQDSKIVPRRPPENKDSPPVFIAATIPVLIADKNTLPRDTIAVHCAPSTATQTL